MEESLYKKIFITEIRQETNDVKLFYFDETARKSIPFKAGQYLTFVFQNNGKEARRSYSIAASPVIDEPFSIGVRRIINGNFSRKLSDHLKTGHYLVTTGAGGVFTLPDIVHTYKQLFFFAAGTGIIPIYSLIKTVLHTYSNTRVILIYSNSSVEKTMFYQPLKDLQRRFPDTFYIEFLFSNAGNLFKAHLHPELISEYLNFYAVDALHKSLYYICGPEAYMRLCTFTLHGLYIQPENIKKEIFHTSGPIKKIEPPDKTTRVVSITINKKQYEVEVKFPSTILQAAKKKGIFMPYSCETGRCGNCMAKCLKGKIWMSYNEVLTEKELNRGLVLTCTGFPIETDAELSFDSLDL